MRLKWPRCKPSLKKQFATGSSIVPKEEVNIKPNISGVIEKIHVEAGDYVEGSINSRTSKSCLT
jgi:HlyD family secretion protein